MESFRPVLVTEEVEYCFKFCIEVIQAFQFRDELVALRDLNPIPDQSPLVSVSPFIDPDGMWRVGGRLRNSSLSYGVNHPVVLPRHYRLTRLLILHVHWQWWHSSTERTCAQFRQRFWCPRGRVVVKSALHHCIECRKRKAQPRVLFMAPLPAGWLE